MLFSETVPDPTTDSLDAALEVDPRSRRRLRSSGSAAEVPMDSAKALAVLVDNGGQMRDYRAPRNYTGPALPIIAIPTTAGSGRRPPSSPSSRDTATDEKMLCPGLSFLPVAAIIDFELTMSMPPRLTADTGVDALDPRGRGLRQPQGEPDLGCVRACRDQDDQRQSAPRLPRRNRPRGPRGDDGGGHPSGMAFSNSSVALVHGMSRPIGAHFHVAHGLSNAMLFPAVTAFSVHAAPRRYADCARAYGVAADGGDD